MTGYKKSLRKHVGHSSIIQYGATLIIFDSERRVLMIRRTDKNCWCFPGGSVELGEKVENVAIRETLEETGLHAEELKLFGVFSGEELYYKYPNGDEVYNIDIVYITNKYSGNIAECKSEKECRFFAIDELPEKISPPQIPIVNKLKDEFHQIEL